MTTTDAHKDKLKGLYVITDEILIPENKFDTSIEAALQGGANIVQYRDKSNDPDKRIQQAQTLRALCNEYHAVLIINDDIGLAKYVGADGVHLGRDDAHITEARQVLGNNAIIGVSCYDDIELAVSAQQNTADYVAFGAMFSSPTKPDASNADINLISQAKKILSIPVCAIGGITENNITQLIDNGVDMAAVISSLFSSDDISNRAIALGQHFKQ